MYLLIFLQLAFTTFPSTAHVLTCLQTLIFAFLWSSRIHTLSSWLETARDQAKSRECSSLVLALSIPHAARAGERVWGSGERHWPAPSMYTTPRSYRFIHISVPPPSFQPSLPLLLLSSYCHERDGFCAVWVSSFRVLSCLLWPVRERWWTRESSRRSEKQREYGKVRELLTVQSGPGACFHPNTCRFDSQSSSRLE